jgi:hypothetical protein
VHSHSPSLVTAVIYDRLRILPNALPPTVVALSFSCATTVASIYGISRTSLMWTRSSFDFPAYEYGGE